MWISRILWFCYKTWLFFIKILIWRWKWGFFRIQNFWQPSVSRFQKFSKAKFSKLSKIGISRWQKFRESVPRSVFLSVSFYKPLKPHRQCCSFHFFNFKNSKFPKKIKILFLKSDNSKVKSVKIEMKCSQIFWGYIYGALTLF